jgi:hypothetical protein
LAGSWHPLKASPQQPRGAAGAAGAAAPTVATPDQFDLLAEERKVATFGSPSSWGWAVPILSKARLAARSGLTIDGNLLDVLGAPS